MSILHTILPIIAGLLLFRFMNKQPQTEPHASASEQKQNRYSTHSNPFTNGGMDLDTARDILGVKGDAAKHDIIAAHRRLIRHLHPDRGGSVYLTSQINHAKEVLLRHNRLHS